DADGASRWWGVDRGDPGGTGASRLRVHRGRRSLGVGSCGAARARGRIRDPQLGDRGGRTGIDVRLRALLIATWMALPEASPRQSVDRALDNRLEPPTGDEVWKIARPAPIRGVPYEPLLLTAVEGASKHAPPERIIAAVRARCSALAAAKEALGPD